MRVIVCGGRDFADREMLFRELDTIHRLTPITWILQGNGKGVDSLAGEWARARRVSSQDFPSDWKELGRAAGPMGNATMLTIGGPDLVVAFPGGKVTADMMKQARKAGVRVIEVKAKDEPPTT